MNTCQKLNKESEDLTPETTSPLLPNSTVILGENSVKYTHSTVDIMPVKLLPSTEKPLERAEDCKYDQNPAKSSSIIVCPESGPQQFVQN